MFTKDQAFINQAIVHKVGNKALGDENVISQDRLDLEDNEVLYDLLMNMSTSIFQKQNQFAKFTHNSHLHLNEVYSYTKAIFEQPEDFISYSQHICNHLYDQSNFPQIKKGDVVISHLSDLLLNGESVQALVILKIERKSSFFQTTDEGNHLGLRIDKGIDPNKIDKGCLILNCEQEDGYRLISVDFNRYDALYWKEKFLGLEPTDDFHAQTKNFMELCKTFSDRVVKKELGKQEQVEFLSASVDFMAKKDQVNLNQFEEEIASQAELQAEFAQFRAAFEERKDLKFWDEFEISNNVFTEERKKLKSEIKLDTGIDIKLNSANPDNLKSHLERFYDEHKQMYYYKVYFNHEL